MIRLILTTLCTVLIIALISNLLGIGLVEVIVDHITDGIREVVTIAEQIGRDEQTTGLVNSFKHWIGGYL